MRRFYHVAMGATPAGTVFIVNENCDGVGSPAGWTTAAGTPNWDYTTTILEGTQSLFLSNNGVATQTRVEFTNQSELWVYCMAQFNGASFSSASPLCTIRPNGGGAPALTASISATAKASFGGSGNAATSVLVATVYHFWIHYRAGTGANGVSDIGFSTTGIRPTSGGTFVQSTTTAQTASIGRLEVGNGATGSSVDIVIDKMRVAATQIGDNGT